MVSYSTMDDWDVVQNKMQKSVELLTRTYTWDQVAEIS